MQGMDNLLIFSWSLIRGFALFAQERYSTNRMFIPFDILLIVIILDAIGLQFEPFVRDGFFLQGALLVLFILCFVQCLLRATKSGVKMLSQCEVSRGEVVWVFIGRQA